VASLVKRMANEPARMAKFGNSCEQCVGHRHDRRCLDRSLKTAPTLIAHPATRRPYRNSLTGHRCKEDLVAGHQPDEGFETCSPSPAERYVEHARVDNDPHASMAAAKASSSSSVRSSTSSTSNDSRTGA
jgi:hypothetical protein